MHRVSTWRKQGYEKGQTIHSESCRSCNPPLGMCVADPTRCIARSTASRPVIEVGARIWGVGRLLSPEACKRARLAMLVISIDAGRPDVPGATVE